MFAALGLSAFVPIIHGIKSHGVAGMNSRISLFPWLALEGFCYLLGALLYAVSWPQDCVFRTCVADKRHVLQARVPERLSPGTFDIWGSSHQIFHLLVLAAAGSHLKGLSTTFDWNHQRSYC
jgi:adiponectin receptor